MRRRRFRGLAALLLAAGLVGGATAARAVPIQAARLPDGVVLWTPKQTSAGKSLFFQMFEDLAKVVLPSRSELPFDRSIAFLVGVGHYKSLKPLPFVKNDLRDMKDYLLQNGFDQVYVAAEEVVSSDLIEGYMMNKFPAELGNRDRLLFYYAGHGDDARGRTGYLQFAGARSGDFARHVLPVSHVLEWGSVNDAGHMLFLLDTCSSGLAFSARGTSGDEEARLIQTLSGRGSRTVVTAGTADEETFEVKSAAGKGNGVFTRALLSALEQGAYQGSAPPFLTIDQVVAAAQVSVAKFAAANRKTLNPRLWTFADDEYRGSFLFLNPAVRRAPIKPSYLIPMKATPRGEEAPMPSPSFEPEPLATPPPEDAGAGSDSSRHPFRSWLRKVFGPSITLTDLRRSGNTLRGKIEDESGRPLEGVTVTLDGPGKPKPAVSDSRGEFTIVVTAIGIYDLTASSERYAALQGKLHVFAGSAEFLANPPVELTP